MSEDESATRRRVTGRREEPGPAPECCEAPRRDLLVDPIDLSLDDAGDGDDRARFEAALDLAWTEARRRAPAPMLLSWWDGPRQRHSPPVTCCGEDRPAWMVYARSRGADLDISIDRERYVFLFWSGREAESG